MTHNILITGATGNTGGHAIDALLAKGHRNIRALVRSQDDRAEALRGRGIETVVGDLHDLDSLRAALEGVEAAYYVHTIEPGIIQSSAYFAQAAKEAGVKAIVNMSQKSARRDAESHAAQDHWVAEQVFDWSGVATTHLRPTFFADWLLYPFQLAAIETGVLRTPFTGKHAPIAAEDQGRVIAEILLNPQAHAGQVYPLYGPVELTQAEVAEKLSHVLGRKIEFQPITPEQFRDGVEKALNRPFLAQHLYEVAKDHISGVFAGTNDVVKKVTGREPMSVEAWLKANLHAFKAPA